MRHRTQYRAHFPLAALLVPFVMTACADEPSAPLSPTVGPSRSRAPEALSFTPISVPGAQYTDAMGINARGNIVGSYTDASGATRGYLFRDGIFTPIDYPGAAMTEARGIGPNGEIVGTYRMPHEPMVNYHGFLRTPGGEFVQVDYPGHTSTMPQRILPDGTILGCLHDEDLTTTMRGVVISRHQQSTIDAFASMHTGATPDLKRIAGLYTNQPAGRMEGYVIEDGVFTSFIVPGSLWTTAWDMNPSGQIVGFYEDATGVHGFLRTDGHYQTIDVPGAMHTFTMGINARGTIVGYYVAGGVVRGFVATHRGQSGR
jgi:uncharacterized membrane protein